MKGKGLCNASALYMFHLISWLANYTVFFFFGQSNAKSFFLGGGGGGGCCELAFSRFTQSVNLT